MNIGPDRPVGGLAVRPPSNVELRPAGREDLPAVLMLLGEREVTGRPSLAETAARERWEELIGSADASPFLAIDQGEPAGLLLLSFRRRLNFATWEGWVPELVVAQAHRRKGIGRALLRVAIEEWRLRGAHRLSVELGSGEDAGAALLSAMGFEKALLRFSLDEIANRSASGRVSPGAEIRSLAEADFAAASRLVAEMGPLRSPLPDRMDAVERAFREIVRKPADASLVAEEGGTVIGICTLEIRTDLRSNSIEAWIPELVVSEPFRGRGLGRALLQSGLRLARERGAGRAALESGPQRATAQALYRSVGFEPAGSFFTLLRDR
jgi:ribosomal protein S18 acetylase RimI-like enzyme